MLCGARSWGSLERPNRVAPPGSLAAARSIPSELAEYLRGVEAGLCHSAKPVVDVEVDQFRFSDPAQRLALVVAFRFGTGRSDHQITNIEMQMCVFLRRVDPMDVDVDRRVHDPKTTDAGLFRGLAQCDVGVICVAICMSTRLQPPLKFGVEQHQTCLTAGVHHESGTGQVARPAGTNGDVFMGVDELKDAVAVFVKAVARSLG